MNDQIIPIDTIRARARRAFEAGRARNDHGMNWNAAALQTWLAEWDRCDVENRLINLWTLISGAR
jgi:hypothetical protein